MKRVDADGNVGNRYSNGNPTLGQVATLVEETMMNLFQEEIVNVVLEAGITLNGAVEDQLKDAILTLIERGGNAQATATIGHNLSGQDVTGLLFDENVTKAFEVSDDVERVTATQGKGESGKIYGRYRQFTDDWEITVYSNGDSGVTFSITGAGQIQYTSDDLTGASYVGTMRFGNVKKLAI